MDIRISINCDNGAFDDYNAGAEIARILRSLANAFGVNVAARREIDDMDGTKIMDANGNKVGKVEVDK